MSLTVQEWHERYLLQARWTRKLREYLLMQVEADKLFSTLEVGCGTGVILDDLFITPRHQVKGLDINIDNLHYASQTTLRTEFTCGDAHQLPYPKASFDLCVCHYLLLWLTDPLRGLNEMRRVTRPGGIILAFAEPDYGGRIDFPEELEILGEWQASSLQRQGADPRIGRKLRTLFNQAELIDVEVGVLGGEWRINSTVEEIESEWRVIHSDLSSEPEKTAKLIELESIDKIAWAKRERILYVPTFYAWGRIA